MIGYFVLHPMNVWLATQGLAPPPPLNPRGGDNITPLLFFVFETSYFYSNKKIKIFGKSLY